MKFWCEKTPFTSLMVPKKKRIGIKVMIHNSFNLVKKMGEIKDSFFTVIILNENDKLVT